MKNNRNAMYSFLRNGAVFALVLICSAQAVAQTRTITGTVFDSDSGETFPGVTVFAKISNTGTVTDVAGNYIITVKADETDLQFSFMGYDTKTVALGKSTKINVNLDVSALRMEELVVIGYGTAKKSDLTGSLSSVGEKALADGSPLTLLGALAGKAAGVQIIQTDNGPGAGMSIKIRGGNTLTGGTQPLFVIDGFPILPDDDPASNPLSDIGVSQIQSIEILKDASATAIFGAEGANGVVIVTTRKGTAGRPIISLNFSRSLSQIAKYPDVLTPEEYIGIIGAKYEAFRYMEGLAFYGYERVQRLRGKEGCRWLKEITRLANTTNADVSFNGGYKGFNYAASAGYLRQEGVMKNSAFNRMTFNANLEQKLYDKLKIGCSLRLSVSKSAGLVNTWEEQSITKIAVQQNPFVSLQDGLNLAEDENSMYTDEDPVNYINTVDLGNEVKRMLANFYLSYDITKDLELYASYGMHSQFKDTYGFYPSTTRKGHDVGGKGRFDFGDTGNTAFQIRLSYNKNWAGHNLNATLAFENKSNVYKKYSQDEICSFGSADAGIFDLSSAAMSAIPKNLYTDDRMLSYLARAIYGYKGRYLLTASLRVDGSSKFGKNNKYGYFPSVALGWVISEESFMKDVQGVDLLKLRFSHGVTGNNQIPSYSSLATLGSVLYPMGGDSITAGMIPTSISNPDLRWERTSQYDTGLDMVFFNNRLSVTMDGYYKKTDDLLLEVILPGSTGYTKAIQNIGSISNAGFEFSLGAHIISTKDFDWAMNFNISTNASKVLDLGNARENFYTRDFYHRIKNDVLVRVGDPVGIYYGYIEDGVYNTETEIAQSAQNKVIFAELGASKLVDVNGDGVITEADRVPLAKTAPDFIGGLGGTFTYKGFDLGIFMRYSYGNDIVNGNISPLAEVGNNNYNTTHAMMASAYTPANTNGNYYGMAERAIANNFTSAFVEDGSFLKCDHITLGYTLPERLHARFFRKLRAYAGVNNPFIITRYSGSDPEVTTGWGTVAKVGPGCDVGTYPRSRMYVLGLSISL